MAYKFHWKTIFLGWKLSPDPNYPTFLLILFNFEINADSSSLVLISRRNSNFNYPVSVSYLKKYKHSQNPNLTSTQRLGLTWKGLCIPHHTNSMSAISQLLLTWFWWNFKGRFLWPFRTDSNCQGDICPHNICLGDICPYQHLSCYWPNFDQTSKLAFWDHR